jgi:hypothetical protein
MIPTLATLALLASLLPLTSLVVTLLKRKGLSHED